MLSVLGSLLHSSSAVEPSVKGQQALLYTSSLECLGVPFHPEVHQLSLSTGALSAHFARTPPMIVPNNQPASQASGSIPAASENVPLRHNVQLRRADSNKAGPSMANNVPISSTVANNLNSPMMNSGRVAAKPRPSQFQHNATGNVGSVSSPALLHSVSTAGSMPMAQHSLSGGNTLEEPWPCTFHFLCSRYILFVVYLLLLLSLIVNTFLHFLIYGANMSIAALFLDVHHRHELVVGDYNSLDPHSTSAYANRDNWAHSLHRPNSEQMHCDRDSFLSLLDEFYHAPKSLSDLPSYDTDQSNLGDHPFNRVPQPNRKPYPKIFANFNKEQAQNKPNTNTDEDQLYYSSSSTSSNSRIDSARRLVESQWQLQKRNEHRLLIIEIVGLILLFVLVLSQVLGLVAVMRKHQILLIFVTTIDSLLFCLLAYVSTFGLLILLLLCVFAGFLFILQLKLGTKKSTQKQQRLKEDMATEMREVISQTGARMTPCVHVSMEQYEAMTQQMLHRYSSPIVYCPHYNESLC